VTFHAEIMQPGEPVYVSNKRGDRIRVFYADDHGNLVEASTPMLPDPPHDPAATVVLNASNIHQYRRR
jgi:hypothetical protein